MKRPFDLLDLALHGLPFHNKLIEALMANHVAPSAYADPEPLLPCLDTGPAFTAT